MENLCGFLFCKKSRRLMEGTFIGHLARVKSNVFPTVPQLLAGTANAPHFSGSVDEFVTAQTESSDSIARMLRNRVKKCRACKKPNAFTLAVCNACGDSLVPVEISFSPNVFMGFVFGIQRCPFPLTVSVRRQTPELLVMDDLLALSPLHFNVIPTTSYIPDWRYLLRRPAEGLALVDQLMGACHGAARDFFLNNAEWMKKYVRRDSEDSATLAEEHIACGFNFPPSQYQLHIQYIAPIMLPFQHAQLLRGVHFTYKRFFPVGYVSSCLLAASECDPLPAALLADEASVDGIIQFFSDHHGVHYDAFHETFLQDFAKNEKKFANWQNDDFEGLVVSGPFGDKYVRAQAGDPAGGVGQRLVDEGFDPKAIIERDKIELQSYGRPYTAEGKPSGSYYAFPKKAADITIW